jgi:hypothetical protein
MIDIRVARERITDFCKNYRMENPFEYKNEPSLSFSHDDTSLVATLWHIFRLSPAERRLAQLLPEGTREEEPYLFHFLLAGLKI